MPNPRLAGIFVFLATSTHAQWLHYPTPGTPRTRDGKPNLAAKAPRAPNGKPDLSGVWQAEYAPPGENERLFGDVFKDFVVPGDDPRTFSKYFLNILADFKPEEAPIRPRPPNWLAETPKARGTILQPNAFHRGWYAPISSLTIRSRFFRRRVRSRFFMRWTTRTARYTRTVASYPPIRNRPGWATR